MSEQAYIANINSGVAYLKTGQREQAKESFIRAISQTPIEEKRADNAIYLRALTLLSILTTDEGEYVIARNYIDEGLALKDNHADLLYLKMFIMNKNGDYADMLPSVIRYLHSCNEEGSDIYDYGFVNKETIDIVMDQMLPVSYENSLDHVALRDVVERLVNKTGDLYLKRAYDIMRAIDKTH